MADIVSPLITNSEAMNLEGLHKSYYLFETNFLAYHKLWYKQKYWIQVNPLSLREYLEMQKLLPPKSPTYSR